VISLFRYGYIWICGWACHHFDIYQIYARALEAAIFCVCLTAWQTTWPNNLAGPKRDFFGVKKQRRNWCKNGAKMVRKKRDDGAKKCRFFQDIF